MSNAQNYIEITAPDDGGIAVNLANYVGAWQTMSIGTINIVCDSTLGAISIALPQIADMRGMTNAEIVIDDVAGAASTNNITIIRGGSVDRMNGNITTFKINVNYGKISIRQSKNNASGGAAGNWLLLTYQTPFLPLFTNVEEAGTQTLGLVAIKQPANYVYSGPVSGDDQAPSFKLLNFSSTVSTLISAATVLSLLAAETNYNAYIFTGTDPGTWSLPVVEGSTNKIVYIKNRSSSESLTLNVTGGGTTIYNESAVTSVNVQPGEAIFLICDGLFWNTFWTLPAP